MTEKKRKTPISLVLGSGGARGIAHIGVIKWLEEHSYEIKAISGCSIGSLIGGVYATGKLDQLEEWMVSLKQSDITSLLDFSWGGSGLFKGDKIINTLIDFLEDKQIEELPIPFTAVAADIEAEKEVWINKGSLFEAIRASVSLPLFFTPVVKDDALLIDGGILNPVPIAPTFNDQTEMTIAVNLGGPIEKVVSDESKSKEDTKRSSELEKAMRRFMDSLQIENLSPKKKKQWTMYEVADKAFDTMQSAIATMKIASYPPDVVINIARNACGTLEFDRSAEMIQLGYDKAKTTFETASK